MSSPAPDPRPTRRRFSKILATLGPASRNPEVMRLLVDAGADAFRLNFSHGSHDDHGANVETIRRIERDTGAPIAIVADMQGPKIRVGDLGEGLELKWGETLEMRLGESAPAGAIPVPHPEVFRVSEPGHRLKLDDGKLQVTVAASGTEVMQVKVDVPGRLTSRKGLNVIDAVLPVSAMTEKDAQDMRFALEAGADYIALSFVQTAADVEEARAIIDAHGGGERAGIVVKLEKPAALDNLDAILDAADCAMVARGDLGVELPLEQVPVAQRRIIRECRKRGMPVIVATHMLESMIDAPTPTRAEASDVASAIYQGADVVMLSAETAVGRHPATAVAVMDRILSAAESDSFYWDAMAALELPKDETAEDAISGAARATARVLGCRAVFGLTSSGSTVLRIARERPPCRIYGLTPRIETARRLALCWGVEPHLLDDPKGFDDMALSVDTLARDVLGFGPGDTYAITAGVPFGVAGTTNTLKVGRVD